MLSLRVARTILILLAFGALVAMPAALTSGFHLTLGVVDLGRLGVAEFGVVGDLVPSLLLLLVAGIGAVVGSYAARNLVGQHRLRRFAVLEVSAVLGLASAVAAPSLVQLALGWTVGGLAVAAMVGHPGTVQSRTSSRLMVARLVVGDAALWVAVVLSGLVLGTLELGSLARAVAAASGQAVTAVALLVVVAGIARSALVPMHRWLPETAEAPSPVSALLHAGLVNGVGVLSLLLWPVLAASVPARAVLFVAAVATAVLGTAQVRTRPDVKGRLAASTTAQMGYLGLQVALGLPAAVLAHLVGHGMWKASLFLGAGGAVERARRAVGHPRPGGALRAVRVSLVALVVVAAASSVPGPWGPPLVQGPASALPALLAAVSLAVALWGGWRLGSRAHAVAVAGSVIAVVVYLLGLRALTAATDSVLAPATPGWGEPGAWAVGVLVAMLVATGAVFWWFDGRARSGQARPGVEVVACTSLPPTPVREAVRRRPVIGADLIAAAQRRPDDAEVGQARAVLLVAADAVAPLWPLESFVASNPLASLESLGFHDALTVASRLWGSLTGPGADLLRRAVAAGRIDDQAFARAAADLVEGPEDLVAGVRRVDVVRQVLLHDAGAATPVRPPRSAFVDLMHGRVYGATAWSPAPGGVWASVRGTHRLDRVLRVRGARELALALPDEPDRAVAVLLRLLDVPDADRVPVVGQLLTSSSGWAAHLAWRLRQGVPVPGVSATDPDAQRVQAYADLVVLHLFDALLQASVAAAPMVEVPAHEVADAVSAALGLDPSIARDEVVDVVTDVRRAGLERLRLETWEHAARRPIVAGIASRAADLAEVGMISPSWHTPGGPDAQLVTCIDVRSERLRRRLEEAGPWETYGAAGFFGLPLRHVSPTGVVTERCPVLIRPAHTVTETAATTGWSWSTTESDDALHAVEARPFTPYALAEASGWFLGPLAAVRTAAPRWWSRVSTAVQASGGAPTHGRLAVSDADATGVGFATDELVDLADAFLRSTGLVELAPVVVLCGHGGAATNNPHLAAYDCGACGGQAGDVSARAMVQVLSDSQVTAGLLERGIDVSGTVFVAALHDTTRDRVALLDVDGASSPVLARLVADLTRATDAVAQERSDTLPQAPTATDMSRLRRHLDRRAADWAQVRPEWGLAGNAAMVIGPRSLTTGSDLGGRVFLQSYRPDIDPDGALLESLMAGPLVVGQWINMQYWCSTIDPDRFGAGDKTTHNVVVGADGADHALSGVLTGARGDLRIGLPWQAVAVSAPIDGHWTELPHHDPVRLLAVICAPIEVVDDILTRQPQVARLVLGGWISLQVVDPDSGQVLRLDPQQGWLSSPDVNAAKIRRG
ncbi:MAG TPA: putative inorganic carbon transporter subunit DabA [Candidatus Nanopelagicales bacterium]